ncbi:hypothetical protein LI031_00030 [Enterocloster citroniae]|uniref:hypothetical protein n=1 Tax=Enterocloster citroniae TaxID=358743 RepID=UPI001D0861EA|nr:hypothetical protein [Enterocloster citroniae]MCB7062214.1 hypothetical protein [Enterocloster citroniae]
MKNTRIDTIGTVDMRDTSLYLSGQITIHMELDEIEDVADTIIDNCMDQYMKRYPGVDPEKDVYWDFGVVYTSGVDNWEWSEYMAEIYIWQKSDGITGKDTSECYDEIHLTLSDEAKAKVKQLIADKMAEMLFGSVSNKIAVA